MTAPNIVDVQAIKGLTSVANFLITSANTIVENLASSNNVIKLNDIVISNIDGTANADVTVLFNRGNNASYLCKNITVPANASFILVSKEWAMYLEEGDSISAYASANGDLAISASYEIISEQSISANNTTITNV
jgi:hypothetical protein